VDMPDAGSIDGLAWKRARVDPLSTFCRRRSAATAVHLSDFLVLEGWPPSFPYHMYSWRTPWSNLTSRRLEPVVLD